MALGADDVGTKQGYETVLGGGGMKMQVLSPALIYGTNAILPISFLKIMLL